jgi:plastocyanin
MSKPGIVVVVGVVVVGLASAGLYFGCAEKKPDAATVTPPAPPPVAVAPTSAPAAPQGKGNISGEVTLTGTPPVMQPLKRGADPVCAKTPMNDESAIVHDGRVENVVVRVKNAPDAPTPAAPVVLEQKDCMYRPRVQGAIQGQQVIVKNEDGTLHNVHSYEGTKTLFNQAQPQKSAPIEKKLDGPGVVKLKCDVHPWMTGYVSVTNNPYFAVTGAGGAFEIKDVPAGQYTLEAWHEKFGTKTVTVTVAPGETAKVTVSYSADDRG